LLVSRPDVVLFAADPFAARGFARRAVRVRDGAVALVGVAGVVGVLGGGVWAVWEPDALSLR
jgi:hypothetical protein